MDEKEKKKLIIVYPDADSQILEIFPLELIDKLKSMGEYHVFAGKPPNHLVYIERVKDADAILLGWSIPNEVLRHCNRLKIISFTGIGAENFIDISFAVSRGIVVTNTPRYGDQAVAEHTIGLIFAVAKNIALHDSSLKKGIWDQSTPSIELGDKVLGIVGIGSIGGIVAKMGKALGMKVIAWTKHPDEERAKRCGVTFVSLEKLFKTADIISVHLPLNEETRGIISGRELELIKQGAIFVNTARAELVDTDTLISLLNDGRIAGAGLDVFEEEPLPKRHPLLKIKNVTLTPHIAFNTPEAIKRLLRIAVDNIWGYFHNNPRNIITKT